MPDVYDRIETLCRERGINVTAMCTAAAVSRAALSDYKLGRSHSLSTALLSKIAAYFDVSTDYLLTGKDEARMFLPLRGCRGIPDFSQKTEAREPDFLFPLETELPEEELAAYEVPMGMSDLPQNILPGDRLALFRTEGIPEDGVYFLWDGKNEPVLRRVTPCAGGWIFSGGEKPAFESSIAGWKLCARVVARLSLFLNE